MPKKPKPISEERKAELLELLKLEDIALAARNKFNVAALEYLHKHKVKSEDNRAAVEDEGGDGLLAVLRKVRKTKNGVTAEVDHSCVRAGWVTPSAQSPMEFAILGNIIANEGAKHGVECP